MPWQICLNSHAPAVKLHETTVIDFDVSIEWCHCKNWAPWPDLPFESQKYITYISETVRASTTSLVVFFYRFWHLPSNGVIAKTVLRDHYLFFKAKKLISMKRLELAQKCMEQLAYFYICHRIASMRKLYSVTLTYLSKVKNFKR